MNYFIAPGLRFDSCPDQIIDFVSRSLKVKVEDMLSRKRDAEIADARCIAIYFIYKKFPKKTLKEIATMFNLTSHATVIHSIKKLNDAQRFNTAFKLKIKPLLKVLEP